MKTLNKTQFKNIKTGEIFAYIDDDYTYIIEKRSETSVVFLADSNYSMIISPNLGKEVSFFILRVEKKEDIRIPITIFFNNIYRLSKEDQSLWKTE